MSQPIVCDTLDQQCFLTHPAYDGNNGVFPDPPSVGGAQQVYSGHGAPGAFEPDDPDLPALFYNLDSPFETFKWDGSAWT